jgi:sterol desaturase/sphingolipid hydroxylase (fatty acid hydroxylase superfamily)
MKKIHSYHHKYPEKLQYSGFNPWLDMLMGTFPKVDNV